MWYAIEILSNSLRLVFWNVWVMCVCTTLRGVWQNCKNFSTFQPWAGNSLNISSYFLQPSLTLKYCSCCQHCKPEDLSFKSFISMSIAFVHCTRKSFINVWFTFWVTKDTGMHFTKTCPIILLRLFSFYIFETLF